MSRPSSLIDAFRSDFITMVPPEPWHKIANCLVVCYFTQLHAAKLAFTVWTSDDNKREAILMSVVRVNDSLLTISRKWSEKAFLCWHGSFSSEEGTVLRIYCNAGRARVRGPAAGGRPASELGRSSSESLQFALLGVCLRRLHLNSIMKLKLAFIDFEPVCSTRLAQTSNCLFTFILFKLFTLRLIAFSC